MLNYFGCVNADNTYCYKDGFIEKLFPEQMTNHKTEREIKAPNSS